MASTIAVIVWSLVFWLVGINGFSAGAAAALHIWKGKVRLRTRVLLACGIAGLLPSSLLVMIAAVEDAGGSLEAGMGFTIAFVGSLLVTGLVSLPGALIVSRKLAGPGDAWRSFE